MSRLWTKPTKWHVGPAKIQISIGIHPVWSVFAVCLKKAWVLGYPLSAQRRLWSDGHMPRLIWVFAGCTAILLDLSWGSSYQNWECTWWSNSSLATRRFVCKAVWLLSGLLRLLFLFFFLWANCKMWAILWENLLLSHENNKGTDQPAHPDSLISALLFAARMV